MRIIDKLSLNKNYYSIDTFQINYIISRLRENAVEYIISRRRKIIKNPYLLINDLLN